MVREQKARWRRFWVTQRVQFVQQMPRWQPEILKLWFGDLPGSAIIQVVFIVIVLLVLVVHFVICTIMLLMEGFETVTSWWAEDRSPA